MAVILQRFTNMPINLVYQMTRVSNTQHLIYQIVNALTLIYAEIAYRQLQLPVKMALKIVRLLLTKSTMYLSTTIYLALTR